MSGNVQVTITWVGKDIQTLRPHWTMQECESVLESLATDIEEMSIERGWDIISDLLENEYPTSKGGEG